MSDLLTQLAARTLEVTPVLQPNLASLFAPAPAPLGEPIWEPEFVDFDTPQTETTPESATSTLASRPAVLVPPPTSISPPLPLTRVPPRPNRSTPAPINLSEPPSSVASPASAVNAVIASVPQTVPASVQLAIDPTPPRSPNLPPAELLSSSISSHPPSPPPPFPPPPSPSPQILKSPQRVLVTQQPAVTSDRSGTGDRPALSFPVPPAAPLPLNHATQEDTPPLTQNASESFIQNAFESELSIPPSPISPSLHPPLPPSPSSTIQVTIGRIEVRFTSPTPSPKPARAAQSGPALSLQDYLKQRQGGQP